MPTIHDIAKRSRVSVMTVSRAMNSPGKVSEQTIRRIRKVMDQLGYQPNHIARSLVRKKTNTIGIVMPDIKNTFFNNWFRYVESYSRSFNYNLLLCNTDENVAHEMDHVRFLQAQRVDGIILVAHSGDSAVYLQKTKMPFVLADRIFPGIRADCVSTDHYAGAFAATEYLISLGHRNIAVLRGPGIIFPDVERFRGFADAMKKHKIVFPPASIKNCEFLEPLAYDAVGMLLKGDRPPTAIFSFNSLMTIGAVKALRTLNRSVPGDVSLVGYDEIPGHSIFTPSVAYVRQPIEQLGKIATEMLLHAIDHPTQKRFRKIFLQPELIPGESCRDVKK